MVKNTTGKRRKNVNRMAKLVTSDDRFADIATNPLFEEIPKKKKKILIDERFKSMFSDERFKSGKPTKIDKRGRVLDLSSTKYLSNLYDLEDEEKEKSEDELNNEADDIEDSIKDDSDVNLDEKLSSASGSDEEPDLGKYEIKINLARGEGNVSSSSSDDESEEDEEDIVEESTLNVKSDNENHIEWASRRIAICNLDWDRLQAVDLMVVLNSFKPETGKILSLSIYLSEFGHERLSHENTNGPQIKFDDDKNIEKNKQAIRTYQLERLKYYYAVCEFDTDETAIAVYEGCDGAEYETSGVRMDLRFIPPEMDFDESRLHERVTSEDVNLEKYKPKKFESFALANSNAKLTWDETDPQRAIRVKEAFNETANLDNFENLIAPPSSDSEEMERVPKKSTKLKKAKQSVEDDLSDSEDEFVEKPEVTKSNKKKESWKQKRKRAIKEKKDGTKVENVNLSDPRFSALFTNSAFSIDKTHSQYKGGNMAEKQIHEKIKRTKK